MSLLRDESLSKKLLSQGFWVYFFTVLIVPAGYVFRIILSYQFDVTTVGIFFSVVGLITLLTSYNDFGLTNSLKYFLPKFWIEKRFDAMKTALFMSLCIQIGTAILIACFLWFGGAEWLAVHHFDQPIAEPLLRITAIYFLFINLVEVLSTVLAAFQDVFREKISYFLRMWGISAIAVLLYFLGYKQISLYAWAWIGGLVLALFFLLYVYFRFYRHYFAQGSFRIASLNMKKYSKYALWSFVGINATLLMTQIDQQMIVNMLGGYDAGLYTNYLSLFNAFVTLSAPLIAVIFPIVVELYTKREDKKMFLLNRILFNYYFLLGLAGTAFYLLLGPRIATVMFGSDFVFSGVLLQYAAAFLPVLIVNNIVNTLLSGIGEIDKYVRIVLIASVVNIVLNFVGIHFFGLLGAIYATMLSWLFVTVATYRRLRCYMHIDRDWPFLAKNISLLIVSAGLMYLFLYHFQEQLFFGIIYLDIIVLAILFMLFLLPLLFANIDKLRILYREIVAFRS